MSSSVVNECGVCRKSLRNRSSRHYHGNCANPELKPFKCYHCDRTFSSKSHKMFHEEIHRSQRLPCKQCDKSYQHQRDLDIHMREHETNTVHKCNKCLEHFESQVALLRHKRKHAEIKRFECDQCEMTFSLKGNLTKHANIIHAKKKLFKCDQCDKTFYRNNALKFHKLNHTQRSFQCNSCAKVFVDSRNLERHLKTHIALKEFKCDLCGISSSRKDNILRHAKSFHSEYDPNKIVHRSELGVQLTSIKKDAQQSQSLPENNSVSKPMEVISNRISVIQVVGTPKSLNKSSSVISQNVITKSEPPPKSVPKVDPLEIYRKILRPSNEDDEEYIQSSSTSARSDEFLIPTTTQTPSAAVAADVNSSLNNISSINNFSEVHWRKRKSQIFTNSTR
ncbi:gastrula zinc finger protein XlCGF52.1 [Toxorhynchites rutilus septentrionalis]|uniref:gastrula zinc finger protein XlCGF52.1 n=1 Tax=Toxorhynchites rutilus septentrionalis TaxID=329112 RepID=UPI0024788337|nr:gastrula zinc finger protein XlCGF52.1 [Toxorhynchites rutilus septentrionalis]